MDFSNIQNHHIFNELDRFGLLLGLKRLNGELNAAYKKRLMDVFVHRANSTNKGLLYGITRELGLEVTNQISIKPTGVDPAFGIAIKGTKFCIYSDYYAQTFFEVSGVEQEFDTWDIDGGAYTLQEIIDIINNTAGVPFSATAIASDLAERSATLIPCNNIDKQINEYISDGGIRISLEHTYIVPGSEYISSDNMTNHVSTEGAVVAVGDYFIDYVSGQIVCFLIPSEGSYIRYSYRKEELVVEGSPVIIGNLQSTDLKEKMFEMILQESGVFVHGRPTHFGADIINELLSVHPQTFKK